MFPITLDIANLPIALVGNGAKALARLRQLEISGVKQLSVYSPEPIEELREAAGRRLLRRLPEGIEVKQFRAVMVADIPLHEAETIATLCRRAGVLVNVEDVKTYCDFHFPAIVRRGDLLIAISTSGTSPGLAQFIRTYLEETFGPEWEDHTRKIAEKRKEWRIQGLSHHDVSLRTTQMVLQNGWLKRHAEEDEDEEVA